MFNPGYFFYEKGMDLLLFLRGRKFVASRVEAVLLVWAIKVVQAGIRPFYTFERAQVYAFELRKL